ncbi:MAG: TIM44-like domain-containing protein [Janthinobacterium lividum]
MSRPLLSKKFRHGRAAFSRRLGAALLAGVLVVGMLAATDADARRLGGSRSFGRQSGTVSQQYNGGLARPSAPYQQPAAQPRPAAPIATPALARNRWLGPIAGIAAGLGIGALLSHFGMGGALGGMFSNLIVIAIIAFLLVWLLRRFFGRRDAGPASYSTPGSFNAPANGAWQADNRNRAEPGNLSALPPQRPFGASTYEPQLAAPAGQPWGVPAGFDTAAFLRNAKVYFIRLQAAWDAGDLDDLRDFTTPEMFAEARLDLSERGSQANRTDVVQLDAEMLGVEETGSDHLASVKFSGALREAAGAPAEPFVEVWNFAKRKGADEGWLLAGIQQIDKR